MPNFPQVLWITGLGGAGKTTLATTLTQRLQQQGRLVIRLDGDDLRDVFGDAKGGRAHGREHRLELARSYARLCRLLSQQGFTVIIATISLFHEIHHWNRDNIDGFALVYLRVPLHELRRRDQKNIYSYYEKGLIKDVAGLDLVVDEPKEAEFIFDFDENVSSSDIAEKILNHYSMGG